MSASSRATRLATRGNLGVASRQISRSIQPALLSRHILRQSQIPALALLVPARHIGTEHHRSDAPAGTPPPGFNAEQAKKPLAKEATSSEKPNAFKSESTDGLTKTEITIEELMSKSDEHARQQEVMKKENQEKKLTLWQKVKKEARHYWDGSKLLVAEVKISWRLALKMAAGYELTRREHRQLQRTVKDLGRLVPFSVFIIVPLGEALLPLALKLFPNMLPSTFEGQKSKEAKAKVLRSTRNEVSTFLRQTLKETGLPLTAATAQKEEFANFFRKVRSTGEAPTNDDVIKVCQVFRDDLTLDNLSRPQLVSMCRYMSLNTFGTDMMLRYQVRHRMKQIKRDDRAISFEGVDSLTVAELQMACAARGIRTHSVSPARMRSDMQTWLDLRLKEGVPSTLLVLSNAYMYGQGSGEGSSQIEALIGVLSSIPEELFHEIELEVHNAEGAATNKQRLEVIREQQDLIEEENEQSQESQSAGMATPRDVEDIDEKDEREQAAQEAGAAKKQAGEMIDAEQDQTEVAKAEAKAAPPTEKKNIAAHRISEPHSALRDSELRDIVDSASSGSRRKASALPLSYNIINRLPVMASSDSDREQDNFSSVSWSEHADGVAAMPPQQTGDSEGGAAPSTGKVGLPPDAAGDGHILDCTVGTPIKENDGSKDAFVSYLITTHSTFPSFQREDTNVRRRFTDFVFLYKQLMRDFPATAVPPLPDKQRMEYVRGDRFGSDFTSRRAHSLQRFLVRLSLHPVLRRAPILHNFLESPDWNATVRSKTTRASVQSDPNGSSGVFDNFADTFINAFTKVHRPDKRFIEVKDRSDKLDEDLNHIEKVVARVVRRETDLEADMRDLAEQFQKLITLEPGVEPAAHAFAISIEDMAANLRTLKDITDQDYLGSLRDLQAYSFALKNLLRAREQKQLDFEQLTEYLNKSTTERDQLHSGHASSGPGGFFRSKLEDVRGVDHEQARRERTRKLELRVEELTHEVENARHTSDMFDDEVVRETGDFERIKRIEMKSQLAGLADAHVAFYGSVIETWEQYIQEMEKEGVVAA